MFLKTKKPIVICLLILLGLTLAPQISYAQDAKETSGAGDKVGGWLIQYTLAPIAKFLQWIALQILEISSKFLLWVISPEFNVLPLTKGGIVDVGWSVMRDFANMLIVMVLLVIGFATIFKMETYGVKKLLPKLIAIALLINFSKVIAGVIVDASQIFMLYFLRPIAKHTGDFKDPMAAFFQLGQFKDILSDVASNVGGKTKEQEFMVAGYLFGTIFLILAAIAYFYLAIILIVRIIFIWILVMVSPLVWTVGILPKAEKWASQWWQRFLKECFLGVIIAFFVWLAFYFIIKVGEEGTALYALFHPDKKLLENSKTEFFNSMSPMLIAITVLAFLFIAIHIARTQSNEVAKAGINLTSGVAKKAIGMGGGVMRFGAGMGAGVIRRKMSESERLKGFSQKLSSIPVLGRVLAKPLQGLFEATREEIAKKKERYRSHSTDDLVAAAPGENAAGKVAITQILAERGQTDRLGNKLMKGVMQLASRFDMERDILKAAPHLAALVGKEVANARKEAGERGISAEDMAVIKATQKVAAFEAPNISKEALKNDIVRANLSRAQIQRIITHGSEEKRRIIMDNPGSLSKEVREYTETSPGSQTSSSVRLEPPTTPVEFELE